MWQRHRYRYSEAALLGLAPPVLALLLLMLLLAERSTAASPLLTLL